MSNQIEVLRLSHPDRREYHVVVGFVAGPEKAVLNAAYLPKGLDSDEQVDLVHWPTYYVAPEMGDKGHVQIGDGRIELKLDTLRGIGLGSLLMQPLICWIKNRPADVEVATIQLKGQDALTDGDRDRRNKFYEGLGFTFSYQDDKAWGASKYMVASQLLEPDFALSRGWCVESIYKEGGGVF